MFHRGSRKRLRLHVEERVVFKAYPDRHTRRKQALVEDAHLSQRIIHRKVLVFDKLTPSCCDRNRSPWNVEGVQLNQRSPSRLITAAEDKLIQLGLLLGTEKCRVVQLLEYIPFLFLCRRQRSIEGGTKGL